jgi:hypothetical protein
MNIVMKYCCYLLFNKVIFNQVEQGIRPGAPREIFFGCNYINNRFDYENHRFDDALPSNYFQIIFVIKIMIL